MRKYLIGLLIMGISLSLIALSLEGIPVNETTPVPKKSDEKIKIRLDIHCRGQDLLTLMLKTITDKLSVIGDIDLVKDKASKDMGIRIVAFWANDEKTEIFITNVYFESFNMDRLKTCIKPEKLQEAEEILRKTYYHLHTSHYFIPINELDKTIQDMATILDTKLLKHIRERQRVEKNTE